MVGRGKGRWEGDEPVSTIESSCASSATVSRQPAETCRHLAT